MPKPLHDRLDGYCNSVMRGKPKLTSVIIRNAIEEFLDLGAGLFLGCEDVNEFVDKIV